VFDNFFGTFDGRHLLLLVLLGIGVTVFVIARSPKAPEQPGPDPHQQIIDELTSQRHRRLMANFVVNVLGYGPYHRDFANMRDTLRMHVGYHRLHVELQGACRRLGINTDLLGGVTDDAYWALAEIADDVDFMLACAAHIDLVEHAIDQSYTVTTPEGKPISQNDVPDGEVARAFRRLNAVVNARREGTEVYMQYASYTQRAVVTNFVANILGYGNDSYAYIRLFHLLGEGSPVHLRLKAAIDAVIEHKLTPTDRPDEDMDRLLALLPNDRGVIMSCAYDIGSIADLVDLARTFDDKPRNFHIPEDNPIAAFWSLHRDQWPVEDTLRKPHGGQ
jgi:hypothetical protein